MSRKDDEFERYTQELREWDFSPEVRHVREVSEDLLKLKEKVADDPYVRRHFETLVHRLAGLALDALKDAKRDAHKTGH